MRVREEKERHETRMKKRKKEREKEGAEKWKGETGGTLAAAALRCNTSRVVRLDHQMLAKHHH